MYFLSVILIGTTYPIFLEVILNEKISIGPPFYNKLLIPFLIPFLIFMAVGPNLQWIRNNIKKIQYSRISIFIICLLISYYLVNKITDQILYFSILSAAALYLLIISTKDFLKKNKNISQSISHFGFSIFILSILLNSLFSYEFSANMKIGQELKYKDEKIKFLDIKTFNKENYKSIITNFEILDKNKKTFTLYPEIRIYNQPNILTSEADIITTVFYDKFMVVNLLKGEEIFNVRYQTKPFMIWIWISTCLVSLGGLMSLYKKIKL